MKCVKCVWLGAAWVERGLSGLGLGFTNPVRTGGELTRVWRGVVVLCLCVMCVWILCVNGRSMYLCIVFGGYLHI